MRVGQRDPELDRVKAPAGQQRVLGVFRVRDAAAGGHQIDLAGPDHLFVAEAVAMQHRAFDHPRERLQADVRMRADVHAGIAGQRDRARVVEEAPRADGFALTIGQGAVDRQRADFGGARRVALGGLRAGFG
ncbi:hypothetical protein WI76_24840 [Burkholderia ubonensis]|nr:hypothetical protein WI76_24840 [Burkholderia ubonensis]